MSDKLRTHTKQEQYYSNLFQICLYIYARKTNSSGLNDCRYSSNLTSFLSVTPKHVHISNFLRTYKYFCFVSFPYPLLIRLHRHWFPRLILDNFLSREKLLF
jgi:hypothetical protein